MNGQTLSGTHPDDVASQLHNAVAQHSRRLLSYARRFVQDPDDAHDVLQDVWLQVLRKHHTYAGTGSFVAWVYTITRNLCIRELRRPHRRCIAVPITTTSHTGRSDGSQQQDRPDQQMERSALRADIDRAIERLAPRQRAVVIMRLIEGRSTKETAARLGCGTGTVKGSLFHAVRRLRSDLAAWNH